MTNDNTINPSPSVSISNDENNVAMNLNLPTPSITGPFFRNMSELRHTLLNPQRQFLDVGLNWRNENDMNRYDYLATLSGSIPLNEIFEYRRYYQMRINEYMILQDLLNARVYSELQEQQLQSNIPLHDNIDALYQVNNTNIFTNDIVIMVNDSDEFFNHSGLVCGVSTNHIVINLNYCYDTSELFLILREPHNLQKVISNTITGTETDDTTTVLQQ